MCSFFMSKLIREDKIEIYERRKNGETISFLAKVFNVHKSTIEYLISLIKKHGYDILRNDKNRIYSKDFKLQSIIRKKRKYSSYKGRIGKIVDNHIKRNFEAIENYIYYYNNKRIKEKLKGLTPASYRSQSLLVS